MVHCKEDNPVVTEKLVRERKKKKEKKKKNTMKNSVMPLTISLAADSYCQATQFYIAQLAILEWRNLKKRYNQDILLGRTIHLYFCRCWFESHSWYQTVTPLTISLAADSYFIVDTIIMNLTTTTTTHMHKIIVTAWIERGHIKQ